MNEFSAFIIIIIATFPFVWFVCCRFVVYVSADCVDSNDAVFFSSNLVFGLFLTNKERFK